MLVDMNKFRRNKKNKIFNDVYNDIFLPAVCDAMEGQSIYIKLNCAVRLLMATAGAILHLNALNLTEKELKEHKKEYLLILKELAEDVKDV